ncbi:MAG: anthranilate phosphoribosyltransferase [Myxococcota bacterium]|jgi:anthranilate synthase/phosphoribosyltransferase|nr:anthranilate phosphoribosyltransferase [Myxococcota bacterium]
MSTTLSVLFIDNFDSFTFNLVDELAKRGAAVHVYRNDLPAAQALALALALPAPRLIVLSPGPASPREAGCCVELCRLAEGQVPLFGVCLGHQALVEAYGGEVGYAGETVHGKIAQVHHRGRHVFAGLPSPFAAGRYHSLAARRVPPELEVLATARRLDGGDGELVMAVAHRQAPLLGVQFHPESVLTPEGGRLLERVLDWAARWGQAPAPARTVREVLERLCRREELTAAESEAVFARIVRGELAEAEIAGLLLALKIKGETPTEIAGAAEALRAAAAPCPRPAYGVADCCGTGGDGAQTYNVSSATALVAAVAGLPMAKHGNRALSSRCGSADVLEACGVRIDAPSEVARRCLDELGLAFFFAPQYHPGIRHAMPVRRTLGLRTVFNVLGPLVNPVHPRWQLLGVYDPRLCLPLARALGLLGLEAALVVHGQGLDEISWSGPTHAALLQNGAVRELTLHPADAGVPLHPADALRGGEPAENAAWLRELLAGRGAAAAVDAVALNAGALLWISGRAADWAGGVARAQEVLASGEAHARLEAWAELSRSR